MRMPKPLVINNHDIISSVYMESNKYIENHTDICETIATHLWAYNEIGTLIPQTLDNFWSGHFFPFSESYYELENSFELCKQGFYRHSLFALRCVLELALVGLYFDTHNQAHIDIQNWLRSKESTPYFNEMLIALFQESHFKQFDATISIRDEIKSIYSQLSDYTHVCGYAFSSTGQSKSNFNTFNEKSLLLYVNIVKSIVENCTTLILLKYPIGMQELPLFEKFGLNTPMGGFLEQYGPQEAVFEIIDEKHFALLKQISDNDPTVQQIVEQINAMPDLTKEQHEIQSKEMDNFLKRSQPRQNNDVTDS